jgi:hypothetical protein
MGGKTMRITVLGVLAIALAIIAAALLIRHMRSIDSRGPEQNHTWRWATDHNPL